MDVPSLSCRLADTGHAATAGFESPRTVGTLVALGALDEGAFFLFLARCSRSGGDVMSNFRPLPPSAFSGRRPSSFLTGFKGVVIHPLGRLIDCQLILGQCFSV